MSGSDISGQLAEIQATLDGITAELALVKQQRQEMEDLKDDLTRVAKDLFAGAIEEFEDIAPFVRTGDFLHLVKLILRNTNNITEVISKLESALDFFEDFKPIGKELFGDTLDGLDKLDRAKYFEFASEAIHISDNVVEHFSGEDVKLLADNIVPILETLKSITQPQMMGAIKNGITIFDKMNVDDIQEVSIWKAMRELNTPEMKRGLGFIIAFLKNISDQES
ncbi:MAG: DUF1641 domain-containing protein [Candidatus Marinimicrobia bacterium]|jgi:uncharacterized protein YjgD (DUF1641 family)|nr:DUF1641 domain-containing protein [Candidatus Neomarinimicrobiota bacterium]MBT4362683.1 DUF1641 domain-containing protein [Candidatus Neomarinimicrobiota bacterium]MBT4713307.1 DUF1641 domain-containing protein [Candidatus Neomarinimicrobiota bacterium]MBT4944828.1 DUF1641 domain-containing protein [Candidatus Neomarinimicrobiota bacterium]MBT5271664.1 DUF1641 domain-containing protein [Candidatus Neomarinimicrobiota bacterium]